MPRVDNGILVDERLIYFIVGDEYIGDGNIGV